MPPVAVYFELCAKVNDDIEPNCNFEPFLYALT